MALVRGKYGVEYDPRQMERGSSGLGRVVVAVIALAAVSLVWTLVGRWRAPDPLPEPEPPEEAEKAPAAPEPAVAKPAAPEPPPPKVVAPEAIVKRPVKVRNLLMRLEEAEKTRDVEMAVSTIETIRALPGSPAADLDDALARRLGVLNLRRLFDRKSAQWIKEVTVRRGDSASRLAAENGSTLASFLKLNGPAAERPVIGRKLYVLNHPRFSLVVHRRSRTADLSLNGKFFKRYDLVGDVTGKDGAYETPARLRGFWAERGIGFKPADRAEIELLMPAGAPVLVSEM